MSTLEDQIKEKSVDEILESIGEYSFDVNDWGSCQYSKSLAIFKTLDILNEEFGKEKALDILGLKVTYSNVNKNLLKFPRLIESLRRQLKNEKDGMEAESYKERCEEIENWNKEGFDDLDIAFEFMKESSWDLWTAAEIAAQTIFENLVIVQNQGKDLPLTGVYCWLLWNENLFDWGPDDVFGNFDT